MKAVIVLLVSVFLIPGCSSVQRTATYKKQMEEAYIYDFKMNYFRKTIRAGFHNSEAINKVLDMDRSFYGELILSMDDIAFLDSLATVENQKMMQDSINRIGRVSEGAQGKRVFDYVLQKMNSKWLDSIAKKRSKPVVKELTAVFK